MSQREHSDKNRSRKFWDEQAQRFEDHYPLIAQLLRDRGHSAWLAEECDRLTAELAAMKDECERLEQRAEDAVDTLNDEREEALLAPSSTAFTEIAQRLRAIYDMGEGYRYSALLEAADALSRAPSATGAAEAVDAARWRALFGCKRIRVLGYARGGREGRDGPIRHIGFEWTSDQEPYCDLELQDGKDRLIEFTDALLSRDDISREGKP